MRKRMLAAVLAGLMAAPAAAEPFRLIVTDMETPLVPNSVMELAAQEGYFERAGVEVEFVRVQQTPLAMAALRAGEGEMANVALEALLQATAQGATDLRGVMSPNKSLPYLIAVRGDIDAPARPRRQALRHRPGRQRRPPAVDEGAGGGRRRRREPRARRARAAAGAGAGAARRADRRDDDGDRQLHRDRRRPLGRRSSSASTPTTAPRRCSRSSTSCAATRWPSAGPRSRR